MELVPYARLLGLAVEAEPDAASASGARPLSGPVLVMPFADDVVGRPGYLHGGAIAGLLEIAAFFALRSALGEDETTLKPITVTIDYMRGGRNAPTRASARVERLGGRVANVEAVAWQEERARPIAAARINFLLGRKRPEAINARGTSARTRS